MRLKDVMTRDVAVASPTTRLDGAARKMRDLTGGSPPVCDGQRPVGVLTDRDIAVRPTAGSEHPATVSAGDVVTPDVADAFEDQGVAEEPRVVRHHGVRRLLALDRNQRLAGVVSPDDLATDAGDERLAGGVVRDAAPPAARRR
jgi:CBS domain-containing protein